MECMVFIEHNGNASSEMMHVCCLTFLFTFNDIHGLFLWFKHNLQCRGLEYKLYNCMRGAGCGWCPTHSWLSHVRSLSVSGKPNCSRVHDVQRSQWSFLKCMGERAHQHYRLQSCLCVINSQSEFKVWTRQLRWWHFQKQQYILMDLISFQLHVWTRWLTRRCHLLVFTHLQ